MQPNESMVERVARAICKADGHDPGVVCDINVLGDPDAGAAWAGYRKHARAAIEAMKEPTEYMVDAGASGSGEDSSGVAIGAWRAMVESALLGRDLTREEQWALDAEQAERDRQWWERNA